jgi:hypothetical protein
MKENGKIFNIMVMELNIIIMVKDIMKDYGKKILQMDLEYFMIKKLVKLII